MADANADKPKEIPFFRVTVLGKKESGKTCLINAVVNNMVPFQYIQTDDPALYYTVLRLPDPSDESRSETILLELEDTYCSSRADGRDCYGETRDIKHFMETEMSDYVKGLVDEQKIKPPPRPGEPPADMLPLGIYDCPDGRSGYRPLSKMRMAYWIVFDANTPDSYTEAQTVWELLTENLKKKHITKAEEPFIFMVANKIDVNPMMADFQDVMSSAGSWCEQNGITFREVSATEHRNVKKLVRDTMSAIRGKSTLWLMDSLQNSGVESDDKKGECALQ